MFVNGPDGCKNPRSSNLLLYFWAALGGLLLTAIPGILRILPLHGHIPNAGVLFDSESPSNTTAFGNDHVAVRPSGISGAGLGAFALRSFKRGARVGWYHCTVGLLDSLGHIYKWKLNATHECDGEPIPLRNPMRYINSIANLDTCGRHNVKVVVPHQYSWMKIGPGKSPVSFVAIRDIRAGEEMIADYGEAYFKNDPMYVKAGVRYDCGVPALHRACARGDLETVRSLVREDTTATPVMQVNRRSPLALQWTPLIEAAGAGHAATAAWLIEHGADVNAASLMGDTALTVASCIGHMETIQVLVAAGAAIDQATHTGATPLGIASEKGHVEAMKVLLAAGAVIDLAKGDG